jgi:hypothetical protein
MISAGRCASTGRLTALTVTIATALSLSGGIASAQTRVSSVAARPGSAELAGVASPISSARGGEHRALQPIRDSLRTMDYGPLTRPTRASAQNAASGSRRSVARRTLGGAIGATAGLFAGGELGAAIEGDICHCDDPGLKGALIGAPVGAVTGGILGALFF